MKSMEIGCLLNNGSRRIRILKKQHNQKETLSSYIFKKIINFRSQKRLYKVLKIPNSKNIYNFLDNFKK